MFNARPPASSPDDDNRMNEGDHAPALGLVERSSTHWIATAGPVESVHQGLSCCSIRIRIGDRTTLRVRCASDSEVGRAARVGQEMGAMIPASGVLLGAGGVSPGTDRWNCWKGRIVLVEPAASETVITVKVHGEQWTLKSTEPVMGLTRPPQTWDQVNIAVDPTMIRLMCRVSSVDCRFVQPEWHDRQLFAAGGLVRLKGRIMAVRQAAHGWLLSLEIGNARVSALVGADGQAQRHWVVSTEVELHMGEREAWVKSLDHERPLVPCSLFYPSGDLALVQKMSAPPSSEQGEGASAERVLPLSF